MKRILSLIAGVTILGTTIGCTGPFKLTKVVHKFQTGFKDKWADEVAFIACWFFPIYEFSIFADAIILNSVEFWTGEHPMENVSIEHNGHTVDMQLLADNRIEIKTDDKTIFLEKTLSGVIATDTEGSVLYRSEKGADQAIRIYDAQGALVKASKI